MRSAPRPSSSARSAESSADCTIASCITAARILRPACAAFSSIRRVSSSWSRLPQLTPMRTGLAYSQRHLDDRRELPVALVLEADVAGIDAILGERLGAGRMVGEQRVAVVVEVADQRHVDAHRQQRSRICGTASAASSRSTVMRTSSEPARARSATARRPFDIGRIGVGHRLHDDRGVAADGHAADVDRDGRSARYARAHRHRRRCPALRRD